MNSNTENDLRKQLVGTIAAAGLAQTAEAEAGYILAAAPKDASENRCLALAALDMDSVQRTVLASPRPVTIFGASLLIADWDTVIRKRQHGLEGAHATVIFSGGGNALLVLPHDRAEATLAALRREFNDRVQARLTTDWIPVSPKELATSRERSKPASKLPVTAGARSFTDVLDDLQFRLRQKKHSAREHLFLPEALKTARCIECTQRPRLQSNEERLCAACAARKKYGRDNRKDPNLAQVQSYDGLFGERRGRQRRLAYICIDGRGIGKLLSEQRDLTSYYRLSRGLHTAFDFSDKARRIQVGLQDEAETESAEDARVRALIGNNYQLMLCGGDDLLLVVPTSATVDAFTLTENLITSIEETFDNTAFAGMVKVGAGILITKTLAADFCFNRAQDLCKQAKKKHLTGGMDTRTSPTKGSDRPPSSVSFELLLDGSAADRTLADEREDEDRQADRAQILRARAYTKDQFAALLKTARSLREDGIATSQLSQLRRAFDGDRPTALVTLLYQAARDEKLRQSLLGEGPLSTDKLPDFVLRPRAGEADRYETAIPDLIDITRTMTA